MGEGRNGLISISALWRWQLPALEERRLLLPIPLYSLLPPAPPPPSPTSPCSSIPPLLLLFSPLPPIQTSIYLFFSYSLSLNSLPPRLLLLSLTLLLPRFLPLCVSLCTAPPSFFFPHPSLSPPRLFLLLPFIHSPFSCFCLLPSPFLFCFIPSLLLSTFPSLSFCYFLHSSSSVSSLSVPFHFFISVRYFVLFVYLSILSFYSTFHFLFFFLSLFYFFVHSSIPFPTPHSL